MDKQKLIKLLNNNLEGEHGAIIQYLTHAYSMPKGEMTCEIEALAREEMRHLDWLAEAIVELGGQPSLKRGKMIMSGHEVGGWMKDNVALEEGAIIQYREDIKKIDDPAIKRLLERILSDEESHKIDFNKFIDEAVKDGAKDVRGNLDNKMIQTLNWGIEHEYTVILQYLFQSYMAKDPETKKQLEDQAINEMQHLGWLAEKITGRGGRPRIEHAQVDKSTDPEHMLKIDIEIERKVAEAYDKGAAETEDPGVKRLLKRLRDHENYHAEVFGDLLKKEGGNNYGI